MKIEKLSEKASNRRNLAAKNTTGENDTHTTSTPSSILYAVCLQLPNKTKKANSNLFMG